MKHTFIIYIFFSILYFTANAAPARQTLRSEILPDGRSISYYIRGNERLHYFVTPDGYTLLRNEFGIFTYAVKDERGHLVVGDIIANDKNYRTPEEILFLKNHPNFLEFHQEQIAQKLEERTFNAAPSRTSFSSALSGNTNPDAQKHSRNVVLLVQFSDLHFTYNDAVARFHAMLNEPGYSYNGATGSVRDFFIESSFGAFQPTFDVFGPFTLSGQMRDYVSANFSRERNMVREAVALADPYVDFSLYSTCGIYVDNVAIIFAGLNAAEAGGNLIWPHSFNLGNRNTVADGRVVFNYMCTSERKGHAMQNEMAGIGTFVHEFAHILGLPDLYNTISPREFVLNSWSVMDYGLYNNMGRTPPTFSAYKRYFMGWLVPEFLNEAQENIELPCIISSNRAFILANRTPNFDGFRPDPAEFFMLENRQQISFDRYLPHHGMLVWHINYNANAWNQNRVNVNIPRGVVIVPADGILSIPTKTGDPFPGSTGRTHFVPTFLDNSNLNMSITDIAEHNQVITFNYVEGIHIGLNTTRAGNELNVWTSGNTLFIAGIEAKTTIKIMQIDGRIIRKKTTQDPTVELYIPNSGLYILLTKTSAGNKNVSKFVIF